jgi:hypothetical protein
MKRKFLRAALLVVSLGALSLTALAQQQPRRGGLDSMSLITNAGTPAATDSAGWQLFAPEGAGFSVVVPGTPTEVTKRGREAGTLAPQFRSYQLADADGVKYEFGRTGQLPAQFAGADFEARFFAQNAEALTIVMQHANPQAHFRLVDERPVSVAGYAGREYEFAGTGVRALGRVYLIERAIFVLGVSGRESALTDEKAGKFLDSFNPQQ